MVRGPYELFTARNGASDVTALPVPCLQTDSNGNTVGTEDCLSMILYVPSSISRGSAAPTFMWYARYHVRRVCAGLTDFTPRIHGGSFTGGSATGAGLDGSHLAAATNSIVAVIQYRLGAVSITLLVSCVKTEVSCSSASWPRMALTTLRLPMLLMPLASCKLLFQALAVLLPESPSPDRVPARTWSGQSSLPPLRRPSSSRQSSTPTRW